MIKAELNSECGIRLKKCLDEVSMTQYELAKLTDYTQQYISNIVVGKKPMTITAAKRFSQYLHVRQEYLLCEDNFKTVEDEIKNENNSALSDCQHALQYLKTLGITIKLLIAFPADENIEEGNNLSIYAEILKDKTGREFRLLEIQPLSKFLPKDPDSIMFKMMEQDQIYYIAIEAHDIHEIISLKEFAYLMNEVDSFVNFRIRNFLNNRLFFISQ